MESGGHRSGSGAVPGAGGADGALCHACGHQYPNGHPSAKQRRAHRKHCGKPASAAAGEGGAGESEGRVLFPGEGGGAAVAGGGGHGVGATEAECGGGVPGSAREAGSVPADVDSSTEHSSHDGAGAQAIIDKFVEDHSDIASEISPETNKIDDGGTLNGVATQDSGETTLSEQAVPSVPASAVTSEQLQDVSVPVFPPEPGYGEGVCPELPVSEVHYSNAVYVASDATGGEISEQANDVITEANGTTVTGVDSMANTIDKDIPVEETSVKGDDLDSSCQENLETEVGEEHSSSAVEEDASDKNLNTVQIEEIPNDEPEQNQQSRPILTSSIDLVPNTEEHVKSAMPVGIEDLHLEATDTVKPQEQPDPASVAEDRLAVPEQTDIAVETLKSDIPVGIDNLHLEATDTGKSQEQPDPASVAEDRLAVPEQTDTAEETVKSDIPVGIVDLHLEATDTGKSQEQPDPASVAEDRLAIPEQTDIVEGEHYPNKDRAIETISSAVGPAVNAEVISVGDADNMTKNVTSFDVSMGDSIKDNVNSNTAVPSLADVVVVSTSSTARETNMVNITNDVEKKEQNMKSVAYLTTHEVSEVHTTLVDDKELDKEVIADSVSHETNAVSTTDYYRENEEGTIAEATSCNIPTTSSIEEQKQIEKAITNPTPEKTNMTSNIDGVEENKPMDGDVKTSRDISVLCTTEPIGEKDMVSNIKAENSAGKVEDKKQSEEIDTGDISDGTNIIYSAVNKEKMHNTDMTEDPSSHEKIVVHTTDNVEENNHEETMDPTSHSLGIVTSINSVEERKNDETSADLTPPGINTERATDNVEGKKDGEPILEPTSSKIEIVGGVDDVKEKHKNEETTADHISGGNNTPQSTYDAEASLQNKDAIPASDKSEVAKKPVAVEGTEEKEETDAKEISTISTDDLKEAVQNEEIADKEVIVDSDRSHVSLKVLLADKNVETKEKKPSTKDKVLSFRRRSSSKDNESPTKPGSPKASSGQQDWNSPARLPAEKKPKGKKQQWVPFICCPSIH